MHSHIVRLLTVFATLSGAVSGATRQVNPAAAAIVLPAAPSAVQVFAAQELQKHLGLISGAEIPIRAELGDATRPFYIGAWPLGVDFMLAPEEGRWWVNDSCAWLCGEDSHPEPVPAGKDISVRAVTRQPRTGTLNAVYDFLEKQFGVRWIEPGDRGISHPVTPGTLTLTIGEGGWKPGQLIKRGLRSGLPNRLADYNQDLPEPFQLTEKQFQQKGDDVGAWLKRMRMGTSLELHYGHAFTTWWEKYGAEHPEYFALFKGKRAPARPKMPHTIKMCPSSPGLHQQIIDNWLAQKPRPKCINTCENDWGDYCECDACRQLDMPPLPGKNWDSDLTDRYLHFSNTISRMAVQHDPDVIISMYAYSCYRFPPRREKVEPNLVIGFVPSMMQYEATAAMYQGWRDAGAKKLFLRPNDHHVNTGFPMGFEKQMFAAFQLGLQNSIIGTDYDSLHNFWPATGIADYILARGHCHPDASFEQLEDEYCSAFGTAQNDIKAYYRFWREQIWEKRVFPNREAIVERGRYGNFRRGLVWDLDKYYRPDDFARTDAILAAAAARPGLSPQAAARVADLQLANRHFRQTYDAITAKPDERFDQARALIAFRLDNRDRLPIDWRSQLNRIERGFGDITGVQAAWQFRDYAAFQALPTRWFFKIDDQDAGPREQWELTSGAKVAAVWEPILITSGWEQQQETPGMHPKLKAQLKEYDGHAYYGLDITIPADWKGQDIALLFGAVDESCWVWVNGKAAGERLYQGGDDWKTPFAIPITQTIDWGKPTQTVIVRVLDSGGQGGIWKPISLVRK